MTEPASDIATPPPTTPTRRPPARALRDRIARGTAHVATRPRLAGALVLLAGFLAAALMAAARGRIPEPAFLDEFAYLLQADTFAHGRLTNPTHPMWIHFESVHIFWHPSYQAKYPPAQGLALAVGQVLTGVPMVGVWLSYGVLTFAIYWMLLGWVPRKWALAGSVFTLVWFLTPAASNGLWAHTYFGGCVAAIGGALLYGAYARLLRRPRTRDALILASGVIILANSRPYEGLLASLPVGLALVYWLWGNRRSSGPLLRRVVVPAASLLVAAGGWMLYYNYRVTGVPTRMPYGVYDEQYSIAPLFIWQHNRPVPRYRHEDLARYNAVMSGPDRPFTMRRVLDGFVFSFNSVRYFYLPHIFFSLVAIVGALVAKRRRQGSHVGFLAGSVALVISGFSFAVWHEQHYLAPILGAWTILMVSGMATTWRWRVRRFAVGRWIVLATFGLSLAAAVAVYAFRAVSQQRYAKTWQAHRIALVDQLTRQGGAHLVLVRYRPGHTVFYEWVYNGADLDAAPVIFARYMGPERDEELLRHYRDRRAWVLQEEGDRYGPFRLSPYPAPVHVRHPPGGSASGSVAGAGRARHESTLTNR